MHCIIACLTTPSSRPLDSLDVRWWELDPELRRRLARDIVEPLPLPAEAYLASDTRREEGGEAARRQTGPA